MKRLLSILFLSILLFTGCTTAGSFSGADASEEIDIYIGNEEVTGLDIETVTMPKDNIEKIISKIISLNVNCINENTEILDVTIDNKIAKVNLSSEFDDPNTNSSALVRLKVYAITNTLCLNDVLNVEGVVFLIDGEPQESVCGLSPNNDTHFIGREDL